MKANEMHLVADPKQALQFADGWIRLPLGLKVRAWFGVDAFNLPLPTHLNWEDIREVRILPRNGCFYAEFVRYAPQFQADVDPDQVLGIDPGLNHWLTCVSNGAANMTFSRT